MPVKKALRGRKAAQPVKPVWMTEELWPLAQNPALLLTQFTGVEPKLQSSTKAKSRSSVPAPGVPDPQAS